MFNKEVELIKIELEETKEIKSYEYWSQLSSDEKVEVTLYRAQLVARLNELTADNGEAAEVAAFATWVRPQRPGVFDRYL